MSKLHELLAVSDGIKTQTEKVRSDQKETFTKKHHLFTETLVVFQPNAEGSTPVVETQSTLQSTVSKELTWFSTYMIRLLDCDYRLSMGNSQAKADVVLEDGTPLLKNVPSLMLLELEKRLKSFQDLVEVAPTLDPAKGFQPDPQKGNGVFKSREFQKNRTAKVSKPIVMYPHTPEHPAQTQMIQEDVPTGKIIENQWSGMITPAMKSQLLDRCEILSRAVKKARSKANEQEIPAVDDFGKVIFKFLLLPISGEEKN